MSMIANRYGRNGLGSAEYHQSNTLQISYAEMRIGKQKLFKPIIQNGQWVIKNHGFKASDIVTIQCKMTGSGTGFLYASFDDSMGKTQILDIKKVTKGVNKLNFRIMYSKTNNFRIGISPTIPTGYSVDLLSNKLRYKISTNSLMLNQKKPTYETSGIGFAGFGAVDSVMTYNINQPAKGGKDSGNNPYWDGDFKNYSWENGYTPNRGVHVSENAPDYVDSPNAILHWRTNTMMAMFNESDEFLGWDAIESQNTSLPTGVPICRVMQFVRTNYFTDSNKNYKGGSYSYPWRGKINANAFGVYNADIRRACTTSDRPTDNKVNVFMDGNSRGVQIYDDDGLWKYGFGTQKLPYEHSISITGTKLGVNFEELLCDVEWYDEKSGNWSRGKTCPHELNTDQNGFTKFIFRLPRQLSEETDRDIIAKLSQAGIDYSYERTKKAYPIYLDGKEVDDKPTIAYLTVGRPNTSPTGITIYEEGGDKFVIKDSARMAIAVDSRKFDYPDCNIRFGDNSVPCKPDPRVTEGWMFALGSNDFRISDAEKMGRLNNPELYNAVYPKDGIKLGSIVIAIGKGFSANRSFTCLSNSSTTKLEAIPRLSNESPDGSDIGTIAADWLKPKGLILSTDLLDDRVSGVEEDVLRVWKDNFDKPLNSEFFAQYALPDQIKEEPHLYRFRDNESGLYIKAPYQILYFEVGPEYRGPCIDYTTEEKVTENQDGTSSKVTSLVVNHPVEGKPFSLNKNGSLYLNTRTPFGYYRYQKIDIIDEVQEQVELLDAGLTLEETLIYNELNNPPEDATVFNNERKKQEDYLHELAMREARESDTGSSGDSGDSGDIYVRPIDYFNPFPRYYATESERNAAQKSSSLSGFTDDRSLYVEDMTSKWGASGLGGTQTVALGNVLDDAEDFAKDIATDLAKPVVEVLNFAKLTVMGVIGTWGVVKGVQIVGPPTIKGMGKIADLIARKPTASRRKSRPTTAARRRRNRRLSR